MNAQPYIELGDIEIANALRTLTYLRRGLAGSGIAVGVDTSIATPTTCVDEVVDDLYVDTYYDVYGGNVVTICTTDEYAPVQLLCYCGELDNSPYVDPATDEAPWYDARRPASEDFLGFVLDVVRLRPTLARGISQGQRGGQLGLQRLGGYIVEVSGVMYAASTAGMEYGERWLAERLASPIDADDLRVLPSCPDDDADAEWRTLPRTGLVDGPVFDAAGDVPQCTAQTVAFQLASESPWLLSDAVTHVVDHDELWDDAETTVLIPAVGGPGDQGIRITLQAAVGVIGEVDFSLRLSPDGTCPSGDDELWSAFSTSLAPGYTILIDGSDELMQVTHDADGDVLCGLDCLHYTSPWTWPAVPAGYAACLTISGPTTSDVDGAQVTVQTRTREL